MTEACRYGKKGYVPKENKGEKKQSAWVEIVQSVLEENKNLSGPLRDLLERVSKQPNTPRKQSKFFNFVRSMNFRANQKDIERAWELLSVKLELIKGNSQNNRRVQNDNGNNSHVSTEESSKIENGVNGKDAASESQIELTNGNVKKKKNKTTSNDVDAESNGIKNDSENNALTKKERKEKKKREKYEAQLEEINNENSEVPNPDKEERKARKRKLKEESENTEQNDEVSQDFIEKNTNRDEPLSKKVKNENPESFDWIEAITSILNSKKKEITMKKLEKKVLAEFCATTNVTDITDRINKKFMKSLKKVQNIKIENDKVSLISN